MTRLRFLIVLIGVFFTAEVFAQQPLPHGMVFGTKPDTAGAMDASRLRNYMDKKKRITTVIKGKVLKVNAEKGGWFEIDAGKNRPVAAHFKDYNVTLPAEIKGRTVIVNGVAVRSFLADDNQHFAGDTVSYKADAKLQRRISFEVKGLMVYQ